MRRSMRSSCLGIQELVRRIPVSAGLIRASVLLARMTRPGNVRCTGDGEGVCGLGRGIAVPGARGAKARAVMAGRPMADLDDVKAVAHSVLRHRLVTNFAAEDAGRTSEDIVRELVAGARWSAG